jgi:nucleoid-associated protein YgaU
MHRDVKIGLILGVVLVAVIAALFFRRDAIEPESLAASGAPLAQDRSEIDKRLERRPTAPYLMPLEPLAEATVASAAPPKATRQTSPAIPPPPAESQPVSVAPTVEESSADRPVWRPVPIVRADRPDVVPAPEPRRQPRYHQLVPGDTLYGLAERYLGDPEQYRLLFEVNRAILDEPDRLPVGMRILIPETAPADEPAGAGELTAPLTDAIAHPFQPSGERRPRRYTVEPGDTLIEIARRVYGDGRQFRRIYQANRDRLDSPDRLIENMVLEIP